MKLPTVRKKQFWGRGKRLPPNHGGKPPRSDGEKTNRGVTGRRLKAQPARNQQVCFKPGRMEGAGDVSAARKVLLTLLGQVTGRLDGRGGWFSLAGRHERMLRTIYIFNQGLKGLKWLYREKEREGPE